MLTCLALLFFLSVVTAFIVGPVIAMNRLDDEGYTPRDYDPTNADPTLAQFHSEVKSWRK